MKSGKDNLAIDHWGIQFQSEISTETVFPTLADSAMITTPKNKQTPATTDMTTISMQVLRSEAKTWNSSNNKDNKLQ